MSFYCIRHHDNARRDVGHLAWPLLGLAVAALIVTVVLEIEGRDDSVPLAEQSMVSVPASQPLTLAVSHERDSSRQQVERLFARPLFTQSRRPPADTPASAVVAPRLPRLPRLTGVTVSSAGSFAIFASNEGGKPIVVREGGQVGAAVIETVTAGQVTLRGPAGTAVLHTGFDERVSQATGPNPASPRRPGYRPRQGGHDAAMLNRMRVPAT